MASFHALLAEIQHACALEHIPHDRITALARLCGPAEVEVGEPAIESWKVSARYAIH